jgi:glycosyltransferase involved in cell wall biosynthesis
VQCKSFHDALHPHRTMVVDCPSANPLPLRRDWYPDATWINGLPTAADFRIWLRDVDVVYTAETGYGQSLWSEAERAGVKTVLHVNPEFLDANDRPTLWAAPSMWRWDELPKPKAYLPVPVDTARFPERSTRSTATRFLHVIGRPAIHDRNGTIQLLDALARVQSPITLTVTCQDETYVPKLLTRHRIPDHVQLVVKPGDVRDYWDLYTDQDVLLLPRRFGGLCLPANEAIGAGMPVVMPAVSPNDSWLPAEWLVPARRDGEFRAKTKVDLHTADTRALAALIDRFATDTSFFTAAVDRARHIAKRMSWDNLRPEYEQLFTGLVEGS